MSGGEYMQAVAEAGDWLWGLVQGGFNEQQSVSQIIVDAVIGMIPVVGDVTAVRDLLAVIIRLADQPDKRSDPMQWIELVIGLLALIPVAGGAIKGVGKLLMRVGKEAAEHPAILREAIQLLNRLGSGDAVKFIRELDLMKYVPDLKRHFRDLVGRLTTTIDALLKRTTWVMPAGMKTRLAELKQAINELLALGDRMIPQAVKDLNDRLKLIQRHLYQGDWHEIPSSLRSSTREAEAGLVRVTRLPLDSELPFRSSTRADYQHKAGWPDLTRGRHVAGGRYQSISTFSGKLNAVELQPGDTIYRVVFDSATREFTKAGDCWLRVPPGSGREWREKFAVLESWNKNGEIIEFTIPTPKPGEPPLTLRAWEGTVASQVQRNASSPDFGQVLPGGATQLFIDFQHPHNARLTDAAKAAPVRQTNWNDHMGVNMPSAETRAILLEEAERAEKVGSFTAVTRVSAATARANRQEEQPRP